MAMASLPMWMEFVINKKYPKWRDLEYNEDGSARYMPAGVRLVQKSLLRAYEVGAGRIGWAGRDDGARRFPQGRNGQLRRGIGMASQIWYGGGV